MVLPVVGPRRCPTPLLAGALLLISACAPPAITDDAGTTTSQEGTEGEDDVDEDSSGSGTSSTSTSTTSTDDDPSADESSSWVDDDGPGEVSCDVWDQDCPDGEKCVPYASSGGDWDDFKCVPILGDKLAGEECSYDGPVTSTDDCDGTSWCFSGTCRALCTGGPGDPMCPEGSQCVFGGVGVLTICMPTCDPIAQDCPPGEGCYWTDTFFCLEPGNAATGEPCNLLQDCAPGNLCADAVYVPGCLDPACCAAYCHLSMADCDVPGTSCVAFFEQGEAPPEYEHVGVCIAG